MRTTPTTPMSSMAQMAPMPPTAPTDFTWPASRGARALPLLAALALSACIVVPQTHTVYDAACQTHTRQVTLEAAYIGGFHSCAGDACLAMMATAGLVSAASVVVSGSIAVVGNVVYWLELQGRCMKPLTKASAAITPPRAATSAPK